MALDINGYNATFNAFTDFAAQSVASGKDKAVARVDYAQTGPLSGRNITAAKGDWVGIGVGRLGSLKDANNVARNLFKSAIIDMFGGEDKIPDIVRNAMKMSDFGKGKPLTARRILAVKTAIDASGVMKQKALDAGISEAKFGNQATAATALGKGYTKGELPKLAAAANLYAQATGCTEKEALEQVTTSGSKANRLMNYGGRFLQSAENFKNGLRLIDSFAKWISDTNETLNATGKNFKPGMGLTVLNASRSYISPKVLRGMEKFIFEELACNHAHDLAEQNAEKLFGLENNAATRFFGRGLGGSYAQTVANIPPVRRDAFYAAFDMAYPLISDPAIAKLPQDERPSGYLKMIDRSSVFGRIMKNLDKLAALQTEGTLTTETFVKTCFPEANPVSLAGVNDLFQRWELEIKGDDDRDIPPKYPKLEGPIGLLMEATGCTIKEAAAALQGRGPRPAMPKYVASGSLSLGAFDGTTREARDQLAGDLIRPTGYKYVNDTKELLPLDGGFRFNFPDGSTYKTNRSQEGRAQIETVADKAEALCGPAHREQAASVVMMLSQSGLGVLRGGLLGYGISTDEHAAVDFTLSRNAETGDVTIRYSSPKELPFAFEWSATIKPDGFVETTPLQFTDAATLKNLQTSFAKMIRNDGHISEYPREDQDKLVNLFLDKAGADPDLLNLLKADGGAVAKGLALDGRNHLRPFEKIAERFEKVRDNLNELRAAISGNPRLYQTGLRNLPLFVGGSVKSGIITKVCEMAAKEDVSAFNGLSKSSSPAKIFGAMCALDRMVNKICRETRLLQNFTEDGGDGAAGINTLIMGLLFSRCDDKTLAGFREAMRSNGGKQMYSALQQLNDGEFPPGYTISPQTCNVVQHRVAQSLGLSFHEMTWSSINTTLGLPPEYNSVNSFVANKVTPENFKAITDLIVAHVEEVYGAGLDDSEIRP